MKSLGRAAAAFLGACSAARISRVNRARSSARRWRSLISPFDCVATAMPPLRAPLPRPARHPRVDERAHALCLLPLLILNRLASRAKASTWRTSPAVGSHPADSWPREGARRHCVHLPHCARRPRGACPLQPGAAGRAPAARSSRVAGGPAGGVTAGWPLPKSLATARTIARPSPMPDCPLRANCSNCCWSSSALRRNISCCQRSSALCCVSLLCCSASSLCRRASSSSFFSAASTSACLLTRRRRVIARSRTDSSGYPAPGRTGSPGRGPRN